MAGCPGKEVAGDNRDPDQQRPFTWSDILRPIVNVVLPCWHSQCHPLYYIFLEHSNPAPTLTGTIICPVSNTGKVRLAFQRTPMSFPSVVIELPLRTSEFADLVNLGTSRVVFAAREPNKGAWIIICNGKSLGTAYKKEVDKKDEELLKMINAVSTGAGMLPACPSYGHGFKYLRGQFERNIGSDSVVYRLVDPSRSLGTDLSIFFVRHS